LVLRRLLFHHLETTMAVADTVCTIQESQEYEQSK